MPGRDGADRPLIRALDPRTAAAAHDLAYGAKAARLMPSSRGGAGAGLEGGDRRSDLEHTAEIYELDAVGLWRHAGDAAGSPPPAAADRSALGEACRRCFALLEACPVPDEPAAKFSHVLRLFSHAYVADRWEAMRRYIDEHGDELRLGEPAGGAGSGDAVRWEHRVMQGIHDAVLLLARKRSAEDMRGCAGIVAELRALQKSRERPYLEALEQGPRLAAAHRLSAMYHLARSVELLAGFMLDGSPDDVLARLDLHLDKAIAHSERAGSRELEVLLRMARPALGRMARNSVWILAKRAGGRVAEFIGSMARSDRPVFEFLYPQRAAALDAGLLDPANRAMLINLPTSSGKTLLAELKIVQAATAAGPGPGGRGPVVAYAAPTRALVNQIAARLRRDLEPVGLRVEKMGGAVDIDGFEDSMLAGGRRRFDVLVTTPEKLLLLVRHPGYGLARSLSLCVIDEAHNLGDGPRGVGLEMLITTVKRDCPRSGLLLLTPFIPNSDEIAAWIDPDNPKSVARINWRPNDRMVGAYYAEGRGRDVRTFFRPLATSADTVEIGRTLRIGSTAGFTMAAGEVKRNMHALTSLVATQLDPSQGVLVLARKVEDAWRTAELVYENVDAAPGADGGLVGPVKRFIASELGGDFPLVRYLDRGIGVHHAGLPDEVKVLMERLMEAGGLRVLVGTTTIAQGLNFPVSGILVSSYSYASGGGGGGSGRARTMPHRDFWNLLGRAGRIDQPSLGVVGIAVDGRDGAKMRRAAGYVQEATEDLASVLAGMVNDILSTGRGIDLSELAGLPGWSSFVQYIAHMKNQAGSLAGFVSESEVILRQTLGYSKLGPRARQALLGAIREYAGRLDARPDAAALSDLTGFSPESIQGAAAAVQNMGMGRSEWSREGIFSPASKRLEGLIGVMLDNIPEVKDMPAGLPGRRIPRKAIAGIVSDWVGGKQIAEIAQDHFGEGTKAVTACVRAIYGRIVPSAAWGLAGIQRIHGYGEGEGGGGEGATWAARNLPAMVYHGVDTDEAVLMRMNGVPRSVAGAVGLAYAEHVGRRNLRSAGGSAEVVKWLEGTPDGMWRPRSGPLTGRECKAVWGELAGVPLPESA